VPPETLTASLPSHVADLMRPEAHPDRVERVELVQTHISWVLLAGDYAYKLKKPVNLGFLDYTTLERRQQMCEREVVLNRRLCSGIYLDVLPVRLKNGRAVLGGDGGEIVDYAVRMRRLPAARMLDRLLAANAVTAVDVEAIGRRLARFHAESDLVTGLGGPDTVWQNWDETLTQVRPFVGRTLDSEQERVIGAYARGARPAMTERLAERQRAGRVRDGHGDVRAENVCLADGGPLIFDCIEFNDRFRAIDVASEVAFLAMDLEWWERPDLARAYVEAYVGESGDGGLEALLPFFKCYRALVRGKVESFRLDDAGFDAAAREGAAERARRYFALAARYARPTLLVVMGLSGTGKSRLAHALAARLGWPVLNSDVIRKELAGLAPQARVREAVGHGLYGHVMSERTYSTLRARAEDTLVAQQSVILDATFLDASERATVRELAARHGARFVLAETVASDDLVRERLAARQRAGTDPSDAGWDVYLTQAARRRRNPVAEPRLVVDTSEALERQVAGVRATLEA
jgi:aminoglycoside phosphotransferase family enzyme/predicted kinase